ncbi:hypothetical protein [Hyphomicrobium sp.]|uniref:hypothetical protein n=1 Tax=Hyphomicrobium sp. TaxID=82 RepID=UPI0025C43644|nr:hypothetical protein [Hyphomicrobium sp.]MCC7250298.1 hypothetical protein [Hyphomicrobium sp.]
MPARDLIEAWAALIVLSLGTMLIATFRVERWGAFIACSVLVLAGLKARVILARYLGLAGSRFWMRSFDLAIGLFLALSFALYLFGFGR